MPWIDPAELAMLSSEITIKGKGGWIRSVPINEAVKIVLRESLEVVPAGQKLFVPEGKPTHEVIEELQAYSQTVPASGLTAS